ncbi:MAG TPA: hypothetical protein VFA12_14835 [Stellaceae bacterium]|nr:hypothetical protein [Stellaceae bacterium]
MPLVYDLGRLSLEWNMLEQFFTALIWTFFGDFDVGMAVTEGLGGNRSKADVLLNLSRQRNKDRKVVESVEFACRAFSILRENRNKLIHSHTIFRVKDGKPQWRRATGKGPKGHVTVEANLRDLERIISEVCRLAIFSVELVPFLQSEPRIPNPKLPEQFPMPERLRDLPPDLERDE